MTKVDVLTKVKGPLPKVYEPFNLLVAPKILTPPNIPIKLGGEKKSVG